MGGVGREGNSRDILERNVTGMSGSEKSREKGIVDRSRAIRQGEEEVVFFLQAERRCF
jgi:hypothetical protein